MYPAFHPVPLYLFLVCSTLYVPVSPGIDLVVWYVLRYVRWYSRGVPLAHSRSGDLAPLRIFNGVFFFELDGVSSLLLLRLCFYGLSESVSVRPCSRRCLRWRATSVLFFYHFYFEDYYFQLHIHQP